MIRVISAKPLPGSRLKVTFSDGLTGVFAVEPELRGGVFSQLLDPGLFNSVSINQDFGCVEWPGGIDLCPEAMHQVLAGSQCEVTPGPAAVLRDATKSTE